MNGVILATIRGSGHEEFTRLKRFQGWETLPTIHDDLSIIFPIAVTKTMFYLQRTEILKKGSQLKAFNIVLLLLLMGCSGSSRKIDPNFKLTKREFPLSSKHHPCDNFHQYVCHEVESSFKLRPDRSRHVFSFNDSYEQLLELKKTYFKELSSSEPENRKEKTLKNFYLACMDTENGKKSEKAEVNRVLERLKKIQTKEQFRRFLKNNIMDEEYSFVDFGKIANQDDSNWSDIYVDADLMSLPEKSYYEKKKVRRDFKSVMTEFFTITGFSYPKQTAQAVLNFETAFSKVYPTPLEFRSLVAKRTYEPREYFLKNFPQLGMEAIFSEIPKKTPIRNFEPKALSWLNQQIMEGDLKTLKAKYAFSALAKLMDDGYPKFYQKYFDFRHKHLGGPPKRSDRQERCTKKTMRTFSKELDYLLVDKIFPGFPKDDFIDMAEKIRLSILKSINANPWLTKEGRKEAYEKTRVAKLQLVTPDREEDWDFRPEADYSSTDKIANMKTLSRTSLKKVLKQIREKINKDIWGMSPLTINAYYHPSYNKFVLPIGVLQYPFYDASLDEELNLAAIGTVIGHELGHGIDDKGSKYDSKGKLRQWMPASDLKEFKRITKPLIEQFNEMGHNGELTLGENIGDLVGLTASYEAAFPMGSNKSQKLKQNFFVQYARVWCGVTRPKLSEKLLKTDPHSRGYARINGPVVHLDGFYEAFSCKPGDKMYLSKKDRIRVW